jgi:DNA repair exonuclease SbcCD nuclease subunit
MIESTVLAMLPAMRFLHAADIHLDSPLRGLSRYDGAPIDEVRGATRRAFENLVRHACAEAIDFVVIAGDLYDGDWPDFNTGLFFARQVAALAESGIDVYLVRGNHDAASRLTRSLPLPRNVHLLPSQAPQTLINERHGIAIHGQSFATAAVTEDLAARYPRAVPGLCNIGVLHTALTGRAGHEPYAPTTEQVLRSRGYDYWALGHVHAREIVSRAPWIVYPGNLQGRHVREAGAKGCELVTVDDGLITTAPIALDVVRFATLTVDVSDLPDVDALLDRTATLIRAEVAAASGRTLGLRMRLAGRGPLHRTLAGRQEDCGTQLRAVAIDASGGNAWIEKIEINVRPLRAVDSQATGDDPLALLYAELRALAADPARLTELAEGVLRELRPKLPADATVDDGSRFDDPAALAALLGEAEAELLARLDAGETP